MKTGRPRKLTKPVTVSIVMEQRQLDELDEMKGKFSRGEYLNILTISDNLKTQTILNLRSENQRISQRLTEMMNKGETNIQSFQKTIYSHFTRSFKEKLNDMPTTTKKFWAEKIGCKVQELINYL